MENVSPVFISNVKEYIGVDDKIKGKRNELKQLTASKKELENNIISYLENNGLDMIETGGGTLKKAVSKSFSGINKNHLKKTLSELFQKPEEDINKYIEHILTTRTSREKTSLKRVSS